MNYKGDIIEESLDDKDVLKDVIILSTRVEKVTKRHKTPHLKQWTLHTVEVPEAMADDVAKKLSRALDPRHNDWYADFKNDKFHFIIFKDKIFKVDLHNPKYKEVMEYGISLGIPWYQLAFSSEINEWKQ